MLHRIIRKMINKKTMTICLFVGILFIVSILSSIPVYTNGILQRMLLKDFEGFQVKSGNFPGIYNIESVYKNEKKDEIFANFNKWDKTIKNTYFPAIKLPAITSYCNLVDSSFVVSDRLELDPSTHYKTADIQAFSNIGDHIKLTYGRLPSEKKVGDLYEVIIPENTMKALDLTVDSIYYLADDSDYTKKSRIKVKIVGVFNIKDDRDPYWNKELNDKDAQFLVIDYNLFLNEFYKEDIAYLSSVNWYYALDYHKLTIGSLPALMSNMESQVKTLYGMDDPEMMMPSYSIVKQYNIKAKQLQTTLWVLQVPVLLLIAFYIFMVSHLIVEQEKSEIAVFKSRGADRGQIMRGYLMEGMIISVIAILAGPPIGLYLCKIIGSCNGFLEFVQRTSLPVHLNSKAYEYSFIGVLAFLITMIIPVILATRTTIVQFKQGKARKIKKNLLQGYFFGAVCIGLSLYGLYTYKNRQSIMGLTGINGMDMPMDPFLFIISTLFIFGCGILFLRIFPYIIRIIFWCGRKLWGAVSYITLINIGKTTGEDQFIILFLVLTLSIGIFDANSARTINTNIEEKVRYTVGSDITMTTQWESVPVKTLTSADDQGSNSQPPSGNAAPPPPGAGGATVPQGPQVYIEPPFGEIESLKGVEKAAKVYQRNDGTARIANKNYDNINIMAIDPKEFGETAYLKTSLMKHHWNEYLNLLMKAPSAMLLSRDFQKKYGAKVGDYISVKIGDTNVQGIIYEFIDYWPAYNPNEKISGTNNNKQLIIANLPYVQQAGKVEPYQVWLKLKPGATTDEVYRDIKDKNIKVSQITSTSQLLKEKKNDPMLQGTNGALTLGFIVTMIITIIGFLIYWILSLYKRTLQFGIIRAMGLSFGNILGILGLEQLLISGSSIIFGVMIGGFASKLFIPLLQMSQNVSEQIIPFRVTYSRGDYIKIYTIIGLLLFMGFVVLGRIISNMKIDRAIKLGED